MTVIRYGSEFVELSALLSLFPLSQWHPVYDALRRSSKNYFELVFFFFLIELNTRKHPAFVVNT